MQSGRPTPRSAAWPVAVGLSVALVPLLVAGGGGPAAALLPVGIAVLAVVVAVLLWLRGRRQRRDHEARLTAWAGERAAQAERLRIARDLHDLASHGLGVITMRAAAARAAGTGQDAALGDIERVSRETTTELRRMLTVLRSPVGDQAPRRPAESLADLPGIVSAGRGDGLRVDLDVSDLGEVSAGVQLTVCAVVREGLTNALRHAGRTRVAVHVCRRDGTLVATVRDDGPAAGAQAHPGAGQGLVGLRERVTALGGTLHAGPSGDGFVLSARIPDP